MIFYLPSQPAALYICFIYRLSSRTLIWFILWRMAGSFNMKYGAVIKTLTLNIYDMSLYMWIKITYSYILIVSIILFKCTCNVYIHGCNTITVFLYNLKHHQFRQRLFCLTKLQSFVLESNKIHFVLNKCLDLN